MPHPFLIVAGVVIFIGTGVLLVNEYQQYKSEEEEFNRIRSKPNRFGPNRYQRKEDTEDEEDEEENDKNLSTNCYQTFRVDPFKHFESRCEDQFNSTIRNRFQTNPNRNYDLDRNQKQDQKIFPLIDLSDEDESHRSNRSIRISNPIEMRQITSTEIQSDLPRKENIGKVFQKDSTHLCRSSSVSLQGSPSHKEDISPQSTEASFHPEKSLFEQQESSFHREEMPPQIPEPEMSLATLKSDDSNNPLNMITNETTSDQGSCRTRQSLSSKISFDELRSNQSDESNNWIEIETHNSTDEFELM